jgi:RES domain-containing protein
MEIVLCSDCFQDPGLRIDAQRLGVAAEGSCPICRSAKGKKLDKDRVAALAGSFFVWGTMLRCNYGAAPVVQFNEHQKTSISAPLWLEPDLRRIEMATGFGFFHYGPRLWMVGGVGPLEALQDPEHREPIVRRIIGEYPAATLASGEVFYRVRKGPARPSDPAEYDSPPASGSGRLDTPDNPVMYGSQDLQVCIHECRVTAEDDLYVASLAATRDLKLLDLTHLLYEEHVTEFESLDMAVHMLFLAGPHSYEIARIIGHAARDAGYDGLIYPSYFSLLRSGRRPFETVYGISLRRFPQAAEYERAKIIPNLGLFGRPVREGAVTTRGINRMVLDRVEYGIRFGPVGFERKPWRPELFTEEPAQ